MTDHSLASALRGRRILVVEDEYMMAEDLQYDLEKADAQVGDRGTRQDERGVFAKVNQKSADIPKRRLFPSRAHNQVSSAQGYTMALHGLSII